MRTNRPLALLSAAALAGATLVASAGAAGAQSDSFGSLTSGSSSPDYGLTLTEVTTDDVETTFEGTLTNNTAQPIECQIYLYEASVLAAEEELYNAGEEEWYGGDLDWIDVNVEANASVDWNASLDGQGDDFVGGANADCEISDSGPHLQLFAYEAGDSIGSLDLGSLDVGGSLSGSLGS